MIQHADCPAVFFVFFTLLAILPLLFVHESRALRFVGNQMFFRYSAFLATLLTCLAWLFSIFGWSIAHRAFELANTQVRLGSAVRSPLLFHPASGGLSR